MDRQEKESVRGGCVGVMVMVMVMVKHETEA